MKDFLEKCEEAARVLHQADDIIVFGHRDADGIFAAMLAKLGMGDKNVSVRIIRHGMHISDMAAAAAGKLALFVDYGSSEIPSITRHMEHFLILDHHPSRETHPLMVNPWDYGIDGTRELSGAGVTYLVMRAYDSRNTRLAPLAIVGAMGDKQYLSSFSGPNALLIEDASASGLSTGAPDEHLMVSGLPFGPERARALDMAQLIDACASVNNPDVAVAMIGGEQGAYERAEEIFNDYTSRHERQLGQILSRKHGIIIDNKEHMATFIMFPELEPGFSGVLAEDLLAEFPEKPVVIMSPAPYGIKASARATSEQLARGVHLGKAMDYAASRCNGKGGGHDVAAGATFGCEDLEQFKTHMTYFLFSQVPARLKLALAIEATSPDAARSIACALSIDNEEYKGTRARSVSGGDTAYVLVSSEDMGTFRNTVDDILVCLSSCSEIVSIVSKKIKKH